MTITMKDKYHLFIDEFINKNKEELLSFPLYKDKNMDDEPILTHIPPYQMAKESEKLFSNPLIRKLMDSFYELFINIPNLTFDLNEHCQGYHGRTLQDVVNDKEMHWDSKESYISRLDFNVVSTLFDRFSGLDEDYSMLFFKNTMRNFIESKHCPHCDKSIYADIDYDENKIKISKHMLNHIGKEPCSISKVDSIFTVKINTPSKKIIFFNNPSQLINIEREDQYTCSVNSIEGSIKEILAYADQNIGFFSVSNTSPSILKGKSDILISPIATKKGYEKLGYISTDLWWYTVMDYELFLSMSKNVKIDFDFTIVETDSLSCEITHNLDNVRKDTNKTFSTIKLN